MAVAVYFKNGQSATHAGASKATVEGGGEYREVLVLKDDSDTELGRFMVDELVGWNITPTATSRRPAVSGPRSR